MIELDSENLKTAKKSTKEKEKDDIPKNDKNEIEDEELNDEIKYKNYIREMKEETKFKNLYIVISAFEVNRYEDCIHYLTSLSRNREYLTFDEKALLAFTLNKMFTKEKQNIFALEKEIYKKNLNKQIEEVKFPLEYKERILYKIIGKCSDYICKIDHDFIAHSWQLQYSEAKIFYLTRQANFNKG